jgi:TonB-linked SusC/RagA family outer membrane protein
MQNALCCRHRRTLIKLLMIMKLTAIILITACLTASAEGRTQTVSLNVKNAPLEKVFSEIKKQTGYAIFYNYRLLEKAKPVTIRVHNVTVDEVMKACLKDQALDYEIADKSIVIKEKPTTTAAFQPPSTETLAKADPITIRGRILNSASEPVSASIIVKGTQNGTSTNNDGYFELTNVDEKATLLITGVNIESFEISPFSRGLVADRGILSLGTLAAKIKVMEGETITVTMNTGYQQIPKERSTGSFEFINKEELNRRVGSDVLNRLEGVTTGIFFDRRFSSASRNTIPLNNIVIRGLSTLTTSPVSVNSPLIIVDNFPYEGDINNINPNEVENITVLKDAAAASIYGTRAANGVIVITTKRGEFNQPLKIEFNSNIIVAQRPDLFYFPKMTSSEFIEVETFLFNKGFYNSDLSSSQYLALSPVVEILSKRRSGFISSNDSATLIDALRNSDVRNDFEKYIYRKAITQQYFISLNGGGQKFRYTLSGGFDKNLTSLIGDENRRITVSSNNSYMPTDKLTFQMGIRFTNSFSKNNSQGEYNSSNYGYRNGGKKMVPYTRFVDETGNRLSVIRDWREGYTDTAGNGKLLNWKYNPLDELNNSDNATKDQDIVITTGVKYDIVKDLNFSGNYQYQHEDGAIERYYNENTYSARNLINLFTNLSSNTPSVRNPVPIGGLLDQIYYKIVSHIGRGQLNFNKGWSNKHQLNAVAGGEIRETINTSSGTRSYGYNKNTLSSSLIDYINRYPQYGNRGSQLIPPSPSIFYKKTDHFVSIYANAAYSFNTRYIISGSVRKDAANLFGVNINNKWQPFWSLGSTWKISDESFFKLKAVSYLALRVTYGYMGNVNNSLSPLSVISYNPASNNSFNLPSATLRTSANPGLSWETIKELNIGIDFRILSDRISGTIDKYRKNSNNLILASIVDPTTGITQINRNSASMVGDGWEFSVTSTNIKSSFRWNTEFRYTHVSNKITDYVRDDKGLRINSVVSTTGLGITPRKGYSPYAIFSYPFAGLDPMTGDPQGYNGKTLSKDYLAISNQLFDTANLTYHGSAIPTTFGNLSNIFNYRGISLTLSISYRFGYYFRKIPISYYSMYNTGAQHPDYSKRWKQPGDEVYTSVPSILYPLTNSRRDDFYTYSSVNVLKGDNIRLQYIRLAYSVNNSLIRKISLKGLQVYANIENLGMLWRANKEGLDPDYDAGNTAYPPPKRIAFGIKANF